VRAKRLSAPSRERRNRKEREYPLDPDYERTIGSGTPSCFVHSGVRRLKGDFFDCKSWEVPRVEAWRNHVTEPHSGLGN
jgi:hypothetical protein